jgi:hypothetical protein
VSPRFKTGVFLYGALIQPLLLRVLIRPSAALPSPASRPLIILYTGLLGGIFFTWFMSRLCRTANRTQTDQVFRAVGQGGAYGIAASALTFELLAFTASLWITIQAARNLSAFPFWESMTGFGLLVLSFHTYLFFPFIQLTPLAFVVGAFAGVFVLRSCKTPVQTQGKPVVHS